MDDFKKLLKAAENGNADAQCTVGKCYYYGEGVVEDIQEAVKWLKRAAENGSADAQYCASVLYILAKEPLKALGWLIKSAEQGYEEA